MRMAGSILVEPSCAHLEIEVTLEMASAGVYAISEMTFTADLMDVVKAVYFAMESERRSNSLNVGGRVVD
jgi:hypothetical protein